MSKDWLSVRIPSALALEIRAEAKERGTTITKVVEERLMASSDTPEIPVEVLEAMAHRDAARLAEGGGLPVKVVVEDVTDCRHPKDRQRVVAGGKRCLSCGATRRLNESF